MTSRSHVEIGVKPMRRAAVVVAIVGALTLSGCYTLNAHIPGAVRADVDPHVEIIGSIDEEITHTYYVGGILSPPDNDIFGSLLLDRVREAGGDGVANIVFESQFTPGDVVLRAITIGIVSPRTYRIRADIVKIHADPLPGLPVLHARPVTTLDDTKGDL